VSGRFIRTHGLILRAPEDLACTDGRGSDERSAATARQTVASIDVETIGSAHRARRLFTILRVGRDDTTVNRAVTHDAYEILPNSAPRLPIDREPRQHRVHAVHEEHFGAIDISDTADDRLIHEEQADRCATFRDLRVRTHGVGIGIERIRPDASLERGSRFGVVQLDCDRAAQFEPAHRRIHTKTQDAGHRRERHRTVVKTSKAAQVNVQVAFLAEIVKQVLPDRLDALQPQTVDRSGDLIRASVR